MGYRSALLSLGVVFMVGLAVRPAQALEQSAIRVGGLDRSYYFHKPAGLGAGVPLLISLHGGGKSDGADYAARTGYVELANREGFIVAFPNGVDAQWNDGRGVTFRGMPPSGNVDDVGFIAAVIDRFIRTHGVDPARVFVEGSSNGGMMSQRVACELAGKVTAVATVIASMPANIAPACRPNAPISVLVMNGTGDPWVPYNGGTVAPLGRPSGEIISTDQTHGFLAPA